MNAASIVEMAATEGLVVGLSPAGNIKVKAAGSRELLDRWRPVLRLHKEEVIKLLSGESGGSVEATRPLLPSWCLGTDCVNYHLSVVANLPPVSCCWIIQDERHWSATRIDRMTGCPVAADSANTITERTIS